MPAQRGASWLKGRCQWHRGNRHPAADRGNPRGGSSPVRLTGVNGFKRKALCAFNQGGTADHSVPSLSKGRFFIAPSRRRHCGASPLQRAGPKVGLPNAGYPLHVFRAVPDYETALVILTLGAGRPELFRCRIGIFGAKVPKICRENLSFQEGEKPFFGLQQKSFLLK